MMVVHKRSALLQKVDDTLGVFHTHAVAGFIGGANTGLFAEPTLSSLFLSVTNSKGAVYGHAAGGAPFMKQVVGAGFIVGWNDVVTTAICMLIRVVIPLHMTEEQLTTGNDVMHGEEAYVLWGEGGGDGAGMVQRGGAGEGGAKRAGLVRGGAGADVSSSLLPLRIRTPEPRSFDPESIISDQKRTTRIWRKG